jgi:drug/metabolite transporter (DMT)-like permease
MTRGGAIATTFIFTTFFLKNKAKRNQIIGSLLAFLGVIIVGISNAIYTSHSKSSDSVIF